MSLAARLADAATGYYLWRQEAECLGKNMMGSPAHEPLATTSVGRQEPRILDLSPRDCVVAGSFDFSDGRHRENKRRQ